MSAADTQGTPVLPPPAGRSRVEELADRIVRLEAGGWFEADGLSWADYQHLMGVRDEHRPGIQLIFDAGRLEVMSHSRRHERWKKLMGSLVEQYLMEADIPFTPAGNMTFEREDLAKGFEPDDCYYLRPSADLLTDRPIDCHTDPPPDLMIEVEVSRSAAGRLRVYAAFRLPEVWRYDGRAVTVLRLQPDGSYRPGASEAVPAFPFADLPRYLAQQETVTHGRIVREFQAFVRTLLSPPGTA
jgi:Uma2 family endonuclease